MRLIIAGSRTIDPRACWATFDSLLYDGDEPCLGMPSEVISGGARGPDLAGEAWANAHDIVVKRFDAEWGRLGRRAGPARNERMAHYAASAPRGGGHSIPCALLAFWDGVSPGTKNMINIARAYRLHVVVIR